MVILNRFNNCQTSILHWSNSEELSWLFALNLIYHLLIGPNGYLTESIISYAEQAATLVLLYTGHLKTFLVKQVKLLWYSCTFYTSHRKYLHCCNFFTIFLSNIRRTLLKKEIFPLQMSCSL